MSTSVPRGRRIRGVEVAGLVLAGGRGRRQGGRDKGWLRHRGQPMARRVAAALLPVCDLIVVSANRHMTRYRRWADVVVTDAVPDYLGPMAGIGACLAAVRCRYLVTCPCDVWTLPAGLPARLLRALRLNGSAQVAVARDPQRLQPLVLALRGGLGPSVAGYLAGGGRSARGWLDTVSVVEVACASIITSRNRDEPRAGAVAPARPRPG